MFSCILASAIKEEAANLEQLLKEHPSFLQEGDRFQEALDHFASGDQLGTQ
ncbi:MAG: hypothetical protein HC769_17725 [Cyanobacteria bacterium CRU_2_1]|nr:hypothetical protein [Cyanobacteria bacterium RU_5_0]NJR60507.1 hypothetical protein [Cyanobacteria bacterium CRU_2_1]